MSSASITFGKALETQNKLTLVPSTILLVPSRNTRSGKAHNYGETKESIRKVGIETPVKIKFHDGTEVHPDTGEKIAKGTPEVIFGFTRVSIAKELEAEGESIVVPFTVYEPDADPEEDQIKRFDSNIRENFAREDLSPMDIARAINKYNTPKEEGGFGIKSFKEIGAKFGKSEAWARQHSRLLTDLHPELQKRVDRRPDEDGYIPGSVAMALIGKQEDGTQLTPEQQLEMVKANEVEGSPLTRERVRAAVKNSPGNSATEGTAPKLPLTMKQYRDFLESLREVGGDEEDAKAVAKNPMNDFITRTVKFLDNKITERTYRKYLSSVIDVVDQELSE